MKLFLGPVKNVLKKKNRSNKKENLSIKWTFAD